MPPKGALKSKSEVDLSLKGKIDSLFKMSNYTNFTKVAAKNGFAIGESKNENRIQEVVLQGDAVLDLTTQGSKATIVIDSSLASENGGNRIVPVQLMGLVTETVAADSTAPVVTVEDDSGNDTGLALTLTDGDAANDYVDSGFVTDGTAMTAVDGTSEALVATVTTAAADAGTEAGAMEVLVRCLLVRDNS